jgi:hypothetical protein
MRNKLNAILRILKSKYYVVIDSDGGVTARMPEDLKTLTLMQQIIDASEKDEKQ